MSIAAPWLLLMALDAWRFGVKATPPQLPDPSHFILGSMAMAFCSVVAMFDSRIGGLLAWGLVIGAIIQHSATGNAGTAPTAPGANAQALQNRGTLTA